MAYQTEAHCIERFIRALGWPLGEGVIEAQLTEPTRETHREFGMLRSFQTGFGRFTLTERDHVYRYRAPELKEHAEPIDADRAREIAEDFARRQVPDLDTRFALEKTKGVPGNRPTSCLVRYRQRPVPPEVSVYPNALVIFVGLRAAAVTQFLQTDLALSRTHETAFDEDAARTRALQLAGDGVVEKIERYESLRDGERRTVWTALVLGKGGMQGVEYRDVTLDADTGAQVEILSYG